MPLGRVNSTLVSHIPILLCLGLLFAASGAAANDVEVSRANVRQHIAGARRLRDSADTGGDIFPDWWYDQTTGCRAMTMCHDQFDVSGVVISVLPNATAEQCAAACCSSLDCEVWVVYNTRGCYLKVDANRGSSGRTGPNTGVVRSCFKSAAEGQAPPVDWGTGDEPSNTTLPPGCAKAYTVAPGDSCLDIVDEYLLTIEQLTAANPGLMCNRTLQAGTVLCVKPARPPPRPAPKPPTADTPVDPAATPSQPPPRPAPRPPPVTGTVQAASAPMMSRNPFVAWDPVSITVGVVGVTLLVGAIIGMLVTQIQKRRKGDAYFVVKRMEDTVV